CLFGAWWGGMPRREAWAVSVAMNARGAMEIILGLLALQAGLIRERLFVALVVMASVTSIISGPAVQFILGRRQPRHLSQFLAPKAFLRRLRAANRREAIRELVQAACGG